MNNLEKLLQDMTFHTRYEFLDYAKNKNEIAKVADKARIKIPAHDLAVFKCTYAFVDRQNLNGCTLPKKEVEKSLDTLVGKAVDFDHMRKRVVGHWIDVKLVDDEIIAYGVFFKGNFEEDYDIIKELMEKDVLAISFEAYGNREFNRDGSYNLRDIEFSGGALLIKTDPAFPGSEVLEMSKKNRILEFAKVMTAPKEYIHGEKMKDQGKLYLDNLMAIYDLLEDVACPTCEMKGVGSIQMINFAKNVVDYKCHGCDAVIKADLSPAINLIKKGKKPVAEEIKAMILNEDGDEKDMKKDEKGKSLNDMKDNGFPVKCNDCGYTFASDVRGESVTCPKCGGSATTLGADASGVPESFLEELKGMKEKVEALEKEIASLKDQLTKATEEKEKATATIEELKKESEEAKAKIEDIEKTKGEEIEKAKADAVKETERKSELGDEFSEGVDVLDDSQYELAKAKKALAEKDAEIAELKKDKDDDEEKKPDLDKGSKNKDEDDPTTKKAKKVQKFAWGEDTE
jgi:predicted Zn-ribbon and HTH transcriptional regulator